jgi:hypothetical protein
MSALTDTNDAPRAASTVHPQLTLAFLLAGVKLLRPETGSILLSGGAMKTHRPWQPYLSNTPLFNPYTPAGHSITLDHYDVVEEEDEAEETGNSDESSLSLDQASDPPPSMKRD